MLLYNMNEHKERKGAVDGVGEGPGCGLQRERSIMNSQRPEKPTGNRGVMTNFAVSGALTGVALRNIQIARGIR